MGISYFLKDPLEAGAAEEGTEGHRQGATFSPALLSVYVNPLSRPVSLAALTMCSMQMLISPSL